MPEKLKKIINLDLCQQAIDEISQWSGYNYTPLISLDGLAKEFNLGGIYYKNEADRFNLGSFKSLGGAYQVLCLLQREIKSQFGKTINLSSIRNGEQKDLTKNITVVTATDGNHGRSVAWGAKMFGCPCKIYIHREVSKSRKQAMESYGANVVRIEGNYDDSVKKADEDAKKNGWFVVSDNSYSGYTYLPRYVMAGYSVMVSEAYEQLPSNTKLSHTFLQAGCGGMAAAVAGYLWLRLQQDCPRVVLIESEYADCLYQSAATGKQTEVNITKESIMAGLSCGAVSDLAWKILHLVVKDYFAINDELIGPTMQMLAEGNYNQNKIKVISGESAVPGLSVLIAVCLNPQLKKSLNINNSSHILLFGTEGATDPEIYQKLVGQTPELVLDNQK